MCDDEAAAALGSVPVFSKKYVDYVLLAFNICSLFDLAGFACSTLSTPSCPGLLLPLLWYVLQMAATKPAGKPGLEEEMPQVHRIRITLTSRNVKNLEKGEQPDMNAAACCSNSFQGGISQSPTQVTIVDPGCALVPWQQLYRGVICHGTHGASSGCCGDLQP